MAKVGIIAAMDEELALFLQLTGKEKSKNEFVECTINGTDCVLVKCGIGKVNAALTTQRLISEYKVTHIINTGIAGALAKNLRVFDIVVSTDTVYHDFDVTGFGYKPTMIPRMKESYFKADNALIENAKTAFQTISTKEGFESVHMMEGRVASGDQFICDKSVKQHIIDICNPACVEMEGAAIAHTSFVNKVPFVVIRCMSDNAEESTEAFNEKKAALISAELVIAMLGEF
ncbi:MAG: 5'-methylthioadenosine/adenosylhomocysteine nucleosidase [Sphaerochaetaceae bacterium]|nr:5'-methylthioadenosine/adenosylhomocysteine nucleosidase [Sphaerochaetaceae bacterium]